MKQAGYSGTPLAKKLGIKEGYTVRLVNEPTHYFNLFSDLPANLHFVQDGKTKTDFIHYFATIAAQLQKDMPVLKKQLQPTGMLWVSWYKKSAKIPTDITEELIRNMALEIGLVDIKVCAVDEQWSGLKLVIPVKDR
jgi:hypothetical protein